MLKWCSCCCAARTSPSAVRACPFKASVQPTADVEGTLCWCWCSCRERVWGESDVASNPETEADGACGDASGGTCVRVRCIVDGNETSGFCPMGNYSYGSLNLSGTLTVRLSCVRIRVKAFAADNGMMVRMRRPPFVLSDTCWGVPQHHWHVDSQWLRNRRRPPCESQACSSDRW